MKYCKRCSVCGKILRANNKSLLCEYHFRAFYNSGLSKENFIKHQFFVKKTKFL